MRAILGATFFRPVTDACVRTTPCACGHAISCHENPDDVVFDRVTGKPDPTFVPRNGCGHCACPHTRRAVYAAWNRDTTAAVVRV